MPISQFLPIQKPRCALRARRLIKQVQLKPAVMMMEPKNIMTAELRLKKYINSMMRPCSNTESKFRIILWNYQIQILHLKTRGGQNTKEEEESNS